LFQRISVAIQRFNAVLLQDDFCHPTTRISVCSRLLILLINFCHPSGIYLPRPTINNNNNNNNALNDLIARGFASAGFPVTKESTGLFRTDGKRPDGLTLVPRQNGKALCWNVTVTCPLADSYVAGAAREAGSAAELAAARKELTADTYLNPLR